MSIQTKALFVGENAELMARVREYLGDIKARHVGSFDELLSIIETNAEPDTALVFCVDGFENVPLPEIAQLLRVGFQSQPIFYVTLNPQNFDRQIMIKNGYNDAFLLPLDQDYLTKTVGRLTGVAAEDAFSAVRLVDIEPDTKLEFEIAIFMPRNNKHISLIHQGDQLVKERLDRLKTYKQNTIFVPANQMQAFYDYSARRLVELEDGARSSTERTEKLHESIRDFITGILSSSYSKTLSQGQQTTDNIRKVVEKYIIIKNGGTLYEKVMQEVGQSGDSYSHAGRVSTFAALFAMALRVGNVEDVAVAGVLHDVGHAQLPAPLQLKPESALTQDEFFHYREHPRLSLEAAQNRKLRLSDEVVEAITQHHEHFMGGGYPENLQGKRMRTSAQILALADRFDYLTRLESNLSPLDPEQALKRMNAEGIANPDLQLELQRVLKKQSQARKTA